VEAILPEYKYNIDKTGIISGIKDNSLVISLKERKKFQKKKEGD